MLTAKIMFVLAALLTFSYLAYVCNHLHVSEHGQHAPEYTKTESAEKIPAINLPSSAYFGDDFLDSTVEGDLPAAFQDTLKKYPIVPLSDVKIVFVVTYYRSGASFLNELLSLPTRTFLHFEPLGLFTVSGRIRNGREEHALRLIDDLVRCRMENVPLYTAWLESSGFYKRNRFLSDVCGEGQSCTSPSHMSALCSRSSTQVFKFSRLYVDQVTDWIERNQDIADSVRVIHLVRDPRAVYYSRRRLKWCTDNAECDKASALCEQMAEDMEGFRELEHRMKPNRTHQIRFEDLLVDPVNETMKIYTRFGLEYNSSMSEDLNKKKSDHASERWKKRLPRSTIGVIEETCEDILESFKYEILVRPQESELE